LLIFNHSSEDEAMDLDSAPPPKAKKSTKGGDLDEYNLDDYDDDKKTTSMSLFLYEFGCIVFTFLAGGLFSNIKGLTYYRNNEEDPYITLKDVCLLL